MNEKVPHFSGVMSDKRKKGKKGCKLTGRELSYDKQIEASNNTGIDIEDFEDLDLEVEFKEDI